MPPSRELTHFSNQATHRSRHSLETAAEPGRLGLSKRVSDVSFLAIKYHVCVCVLISCHYYDSEMVVDNITQFHNRYDKSTPIVAINSS
jgi:hypothetical protein